MAKKKNVGNDQRHAESVRNELESGQKLILVSKLKAKFSLLKDESLNYETKDQILDRVCVVLGMKRPQLDWIVLDL